MTTGVSWTSVLFVLAWAVSDVHSQNYMAVPRYAHVFFIFSHLIGTILQLGSSIGHCL